MAPGRLLLLLASTLALGLAAYSVWVTPPSIPVALLCALGYVILLGVGSMVPRLQMYGEVLYQVPEAAGHLALTFDDGPDPTSTSLVLDVLKARGHRATFFVLGMRAAAHPDLIERMVAEGHSVGIHSYDHYRAYALLPPRAVERDIARCQEVLTQAGASDIGWFRPPVGQLSPRTFAGLKKADMTVVGWSVKARDGLRGTTPKAALQRISSGLVAGAIVLLHDAWERPREEDKAPPAGAAALNDILDACEARGLRSVSLDELVALGASAA